MASTADETATLGNCPDEVEPTDAQDEQECTEQETEPGNKEAEVMLDEDGKPLSKRAIKRMKKKEEWTRIKLLKRAAEREKKKERIKRKIERGEELGPSRKRLKKNSMAKSECKTRVVIDASFDDYMQEKELNSHVLQIQHSYSANRRAENPMQFYVTSVSGRTKQRLEEIGDYKGWDVHYRAGHYLEEFPKAELVYLTSESPNVLDTLRDDRVYVIGGLVDHNRYKGLCHERAEAAGVAHARLPIGEHVHMLTRKILACNHVFEILLRFTELGSWEAALLKAIPGRKGASEKSTESKASETETGEGPSDHCANESEGNSSECKINESEGKDDVSENKNNESESKDNENESKDNESESKGNASESKSKACELKESESKSSDDNGTGGCSSKASADRESEEKNEARNDHEGES